MKIYVQGDVLLKQIEKPKDVKILKTDLLHKGANHHHKLRGKFKIAVNKNGERFIHSKGCELYHEEHRSIQVSEGFYKMDIVVEYDHFLNESRQVID